MNNNQILRTGMILSWPPLERRDPCVLRHHLQLLFTVPQHNKSGYETAVLLQELHRWKAQEIPPLPHLQRPCRRLSPLPACTHSRCRWPQPGRAGRRSRCARCCSGPRADNPHTSGCSPGQTCHPGTLAAKKHTGLSEQQDKKPSTSSYLRLGCEYPRFGTKGTAKWAFLNFPLHVSDSKYKETWVFSWNLPP